MASVFTCVINHHHYLFFLPTSTKPQALIVICLCVCYSAFLFCDLEVFGFTSR